MLPSSSCWHPPIKRNTRAVMVVKNQRLVFFKLFFLIITCFVMKLPTRSIFSILGYSVVSCRFSLSHPRLKGASLFLLPLFILLDAAFYHDLLGRYQAHGKTVVSAINPFTMNTMSKKIRQGDYSLLRHATLKWTDIDLRREMVHMWRRALILG